MASSGAPSSQRGATLVELVMTIVVLSVGLSGIFSVIAIVSQHSADPMIVQQSVNIGEAYLEEAASKSYAPQPNAGWSVVGAAGRAAFDDIEDYNGLADAVATDQYGNPIAGLALYSVAMSISPDNLAGFTDVKRIDVTVSHADSGVAITLSRYRVDI